MIKNFNDQEKTYQEKIKFLETQLYTSDKSDVILLEKQNKEYQLQITNLTNKISMLTQKNTEEKEKFNSLVDDVMVSVL